MALYASWVHGNAVQVESPENFVSVGHYGWGGDASLAPGKGSWFHIPIATPVITGDVRTTVQRLFVLYKAENCEVRNVHVYDGSAQVQQLNNLHLTGEHRTGLDNANTFDLAAPHRTPSCSAWASHSSCRPQSALTPPSKRASSPRPPARTSTSDSQRMRQVPSRSPIEA